LKSTRNYNAISWGDFFYYDETSPTFLRWKVERRTGKDNRILKIQVGDIAGYTDKDGYSSIGLNGNRYLNHRIIWCLFNGYIDPEKQIDHRNGDRVDNRIENLQLVTPMVNSQNKALSCDNTTGVIGVSLSQTRGYWYYKAQYYDLSWKLKQKCFYILRLGEAEAFRMAVEYRKCKINELNSLGASYSDRHGT